MSPLDSAILWNKKHPERLGLIVPNSVLWYKTIKGWFN